MGTQLVIPPQLKMLKPATKCEQKAINTFAPSHNSTLSLLHPDQLSL